MTAQDHQPSTATIPPAAVLVGVDGSPHALAATRWAAEEAASRHAPLVLAHAAPYLDTTAGPAQTRHAEGVLGRALSETKQYIPRASVSTTLITGEPTQTLTELSTNAALLVLGLTGTAGPDEVLLGSTTLALSGYARCPLVGVRHWPIPTNNSRLVLVGLSSTRADADVLDLAFDLAQRRGCDLLVLHTRHASPDTHDEHTQHREQNLLAWELRPWRHRHRGVTVHYELPTGTAATELLRHADRVEAVVVGSRKRGPAARALLGSTSRTVLRYSSTPTIVIGPQATPAHQPAHHTTNPSSNTLSHSADTR